jgi:hypothetical protein
MSAAPLTVVFLQISLRWIDEDRFKIAQIPQQKKVTVLAILAPEGVPGVDISEIDVVEV